MPARRNDLVVPWAVLWTGEGGMWLEWCKYANAMALHRDDRRGVGAPIFKEFHPVRQRRAVAQCLCHICGGALRDRIKLSLGLLEDGNILDPLVCVGCAKLSLEQCPDLNIQIMRGEFRLREVTSYEVIPLYWDEDPTIVDALAMRLVDFTERDRGWLNACSSDGGGGISRA